eukprot:TRINITY_DN10354_c0_g2_i1.p1 TRINITY_DN10354_c0_g2~~TRINITY_DN10354_c0_g2_i1.p1  ORF type:complete len:123 (+),score=41.72 TRINITY_DN10354_c0_g2_i1:262-630(+)
MMMWGLCLPNTCTPANIFPAVNATVAMLLGQYGIQASPDQIECGFEAADKSITDDPLAMGISIFTLLLLALVAVATAEEMRAAGPVDDTLRAGRGRRRRARHDAAAGLTNGRALLEAALPTF